MTSKTLPVPSAKRGATLDRAVDDVGAGGRKPSAVRTTPLPAPPPRRLRTDSAATVGRTVLATVVTTRE
jgi:hypothetical protein